MAKEPKPGRVKTRLCPPCTPEQAAELAAAALADTLDAALGSGADEVVVALDGAVGAWCPPGVRVIPQVDGPFDGRLAAACEHAGGPAVQIGMDTPQVTSLLLDDAMSRLVSPRIDSVLGRAVDGGWWLIGLHAPDRRVFVDVPMSCDDTGDLQLARLASLGHTVGHLATLIDVDHIDDAIAVAAEAPTTRFAVTLAAMDLAAPSPRAGVRRADLTAAGVAR